MTTHSEFETEPHENAWGRIAALVSIALLSAVAGFLLQPFLHANPDAIGLIVTIISVLAGFLLAIISISSEPVTRDDRGYGFAELSRDSFIDRLMRLRLLFVIYLVALLSALCASFTVDPETIVEIWSATFWIEWLFMSSSLLALLVSFRLPWSLSRMQIDKVDLFIERKKIEGQRQREDRDEAESEDG